MNESPPPQSDPPEAWLQRTLRRFTQRRPPGDVVAAQIGADARGVAVGKNIIQIGMLNIPLLPLLLALLGIVVSVAGIYWWRSRGPVQMTGAFNIAVADFADAGGTRDTGRQLSTWVGRALEQQASSAGANILVWYDALPRTSKGAPIGVAVGATPDARRAWAAGRARELHAQLLIYGTIDANQRLLPEFYIAPDPTLEYDLNSGSFQLGSTPIVVDLNRADALENELSRRAVGLLELARGLQLSRSGDMRQAYASLSAALPSTSAMQNRAMLLFLQAQAASFIVQNSSDQAERAQLIDAAFASYDAIIAANPDFVRAYIGRASLHKTRAGLIADPRARLDSGELQQAQHDLEQAQAVATDPIYANGVIPAALALVYRLTGEAQIAIGFAAAQRADQAGARAAYQQAEQALTTAHTKLENALKPLEADQQRDRLLGQSYLGLGNTDSQRAFVRGALGDPSGRAEWYKQAIGFYDLCIARADNLSVPDALLTDQIIPACQQGRQIALQKIAQP